MKRALGMAPCLSSLGHDVTIYLQDDPDNRKAVATHSNYKSVYYTSTSPQDERNCKQAFLEVNQFDIVYICGLGVRNAIFPARLSNSFVLMDHSELESSFRGTSLPRKILQTCLEWWSILAYEGSVVASRYLEFLFLQRLHRLGLRRPILYLPYAYDPDSFEASYPDLLNFQSRYIGRKIIVYMGGLYQAYGCFEMLESFQLLAQKDSDFIVFILGKGPEEKRAIDFVKQHCLEEYVQFKGYVPELEIPTFLYGADVLLCPLHDTVTDWARCPSKLLMYMATQKPIVTCAVGEALEYLKNDGFYYEPDCIDSMVHTIQKAMNASDTWMPSYDPKQHTWEKRAHTWLNWVYRIKPKFEHR